MIFWVRTVLDEKQCCYVKMKFSSELQVAAARMSSLEIARHVLIAVCVVHLSINKVVLVAQVVWCTMIYMPYFQIWKILFCFRVTINNATVTRGMNYFDYYK